MHARLRGPKSWLTLYQIINKTWFPLLADEMAKPCPDMNIKVAAFTVSEKSSNTIYTNMTGRSSTVIFVVLRVYFQVRAYLLDGWSAQAKKNSYHLQLV